MSRMAGDFLQSNLFSPTAPTEQYLKRWSSTKRNKDSQRRLQKRESLSHVSDAIYNSQCNNNSRMIRDYNNFKGQKISASNNTNHKKAQEVAVGSYITQPIINSLLSDGLVKLPGPPNHRRHTRHHSSIPTKEPRRDRVRKTCNQTLQKQPIFSQPREVLAPSGQFQSTCDITHYQNQSLNKMLFADLKKISDIITENKVEESSGIDVTKDQESIQIDASNQISPDCSEMESNTSIDQYSVSVESSALDSISYEKENYSVATEQNTDDCNEANNQSSTFQTPLPSVEVCEKRSCIKTILKESMIAGDSFSLLKIQTELEKLQPMKTKKENKLNEINSRLFRENLDWFGNVNSKHLTVKSNGNSGEPIQSEVTEDATHKFSVKKGKSILRKMSIKRRRLLRLLHHFFGIRWMKKTRKEDKQFLVEEDTEGDAGKPFSPCMKKTTSTGGGKKFLTEQRSPDKNRLDPDQDRDTKQSGSSTSKKKKKRRLRKKNVCRVARKIRRNLGYGCRYIGHGLVNMTSIIPEASYMGPVGHSRTFPMEYVHNEYYDPSAPDWHCTKGPYIRNPYK